MASDGVFYYLTPFSQETDVAEKTAIPLTKKDAFNQWAIDAYARIAKVQKNLETAQAEVRRIVQESSMRGRLEKRLVKSIEDVEDSVDMLGTILLGPDVSQEERDGF